MEIILLESIGRLGSFGDRVKVKPGYARNYLIPQKKALPATAANSAYFAEKRQIFEEQLKQKQDQIQNRVDLLNSCNLSLTVNAHDDDKLYGSVGVREIQKLINEQDIEINKNEIHLPDGPIRVAGEHTVLIQLSPEISVDLNVSVVATQQNQTELIKETDNG